MTFVTGDTHGELSRLIAFARLNHLTPNDNIIVCGDFGVGFGAEEWFPQALSVGCGFLFVDGNHEDFGALNSYPVGTWNGGKVRKLSENVMQLMRGQVFTIEKRTFFTLGGAESHDMFRVYGENAWKEEVPSEAELREARRNLDRYAWETDYFISHSVDSYALYFSPIPEERREEKKENLILCEFEERLRYKHHYFGHYHVSGNVNSRKTALYKEIIPIGSSV